MNNIELVEAFELEVGLLNDHVEKPTTIDSQYWITQSIYEFVATRLTGTNAKMLSFEQDQKRIDDLRTLVTEADYYFTPTSSIYNAELPADYLHTVGETVYIYSDDDCWPKDGDTPIRKRTDVLEATIENFDRQYNNTLSEHRLNHNSARPLRLYSLGVKLYTDGNYYIDKYILTYLKQPSEVDAIQHPFDEYTDLPKHTHREIVKIAAQMYLENRSNPRYESFTNEVNTME